jgi:hypothetical protein
MTERESPQPAPPPPERSSPFTSGTVTVGYPFDEREREELDELERLEEGAARDSNGRHSH